MHGVPRPRGDTEQSICTRRSGHESIRAFEVLPHSGAATTKGAAALEVDRRRRATPRLPPVVTQSSCRPDDHPSLQSTNAALAARCRRASPVKPRVLQASLHATGPLPGRQLSAHRLRGGSGLPGPGQLFCIVSVDDKPLEHRTFTGGFMRTRLASGDIPVSRAPEARTLRNQRTTLHEIP